MVIFKQVYLMTSSVQYTYLLIDYIRRLKNDFRVSKFWKYIYIYLTVVSVQRKFKIINVMKNDLTYGVVI